ncbi:MAG: hypothetical protein ABIQ73_09555 [Acidimicrobiales bacterium]
MATRRTSRAASSTADASRTSPERWSNSSSATTTGTRSTTTNGGSVHDSTGLWWGVEIAERPLDQPRASWPENSTGVGTLPYELPTWSAFWSAGDEG